MFDRYKLKNNHNWLTDGVTGSFEAALYNLIEALKQMKEDDDKVKEMLKDWDNTRGNDWYTQTRKQITEVDLDDDGSK